MTVPLNVLCIYEVAQDKEEEFRRVLEIHWPTLHRAGLVSSKPATVLRTKGQGGQVGFIEMFQWKDESSSRVAHQTPEILAVWEPMDSLTNKMEFLVAEPIVF